MTGNSVSQNYGKKLENTKISKFPNISKFPKILSVSYEVSSLFHTPITFNMLRVIFLDIV